mmetsp:Transcript_16298/g.36671  ORF Transcript_16298/g.36671 Transcript_16298/m.36671 type:complete len:104 (-) Transcript_16298:601-912(-)
MGKEIVNLEVNKTGQKIVSLRCPGAVNQMGIHPKGIFSWALLPDFSMTHVYYFVKSEPLEEKVEFVQGMRCDMIWHNFSKTVIEGGNSDFLTKFICSLKAPCM